MSDTQDVPDHFPPFIRVRSESGVESVHYSVLYEGLPDEFQLRAEEELHETEEKREIGMQTLKQLMQEEKLDTLDDYLLLAVLRSCKFDMKKSEDKLRNFVAHRRVIIQKLAKVDIAAVDRIIEDSGVGILPYRDKQGRFIVFTRPYGMHVEDYKMEDVFCVLMALYLFPLTYEMTTVAGVVYFAECKTPNFYLYFPIFRLARYWLSTVVSLPLRIAKFEILNEITIVRWFCSIITPMFPEKLRKRFTFNGPEYENLHKLYPPDILPEEFGGTRGPMNTKPYKGKFLDFVRDLKAEAMRMESSDELHMPL